MSAILAHFLPVQGEIAANRRLAVSHRVTNPVSSFADPHPGEDPLFRRVTGGHSFAGDVVIDMDGLEALAEAWRRLEAGHSQPYAYFQSFDWCSRWCRLYLLDRADRRRPQLRIYTLRRDGRLVLVLPTMLVQTSYGVTRLTALGEPLSQYAGVITDADAVDPAVTADFWSTIQRSCGADVITLDQFPKNSVLAAMIGDNGLAEASSNASAVLDTTRFAGWDEYRAGLPRSHRKGRNQRRNKLAKMGRLDYEVHAGGTPRYRDLVALALDMKRDWLRECGRRDNTLADPRTAAFLNALPGGTDKGSGPAGAVAGALTLDGRPIAIEIGFCLDGHYYSYLGAFDWSMRDFSPGKVQIEAAQQWAVEAGVERYDFLGEAAEYKLHWSNAGEPLESRAVALSVLGLAYCVGWRTFVRPKAKALFDRLSPAARIRVLAAMGWLFDRNDRSDPDRAVRPARQRTAGGA